ncbi:hypothetical protein BKI52_04565 [marine bacterium AO1-C]|nr:hypothetical protein BKI52_04565 [marine bacterium AO1-C]
MIKLRREFRKARKTTHLTKPLFFAVFVNVGLLIGGAYQLKLSHIINATYLTGVTQLLLIKPSILMVVVLFWYPEARYQIGQV